jgi:hypothetical protein
VTHRLVPTRTLTLAALPIVLLAACASPPPTPAVLSAPAPPKPPEAPASAGFNDCANDGDLSFRFAGEVPAAWEGRTLVVSAIEDRTKGSSQPAPRRVVRVATKIEGGRFAVSCPRAAHADQAYPSFGVFVDLDGNGRCSAGDVGFQEIRFAWDHTGVNERLDRASSSWVSLGEPRRPKWDMYGEFCEAYFGEGPRVAPPSDPRARIPLTLRPGDPPCTLVMQGERFEDHAGWFTIDAVTHIATEEGGACAAAPLFDLATAKPRSPQGLSPAALVAGVFFKPNEKPIDPVTESTWNVLEDLDFDGYADLCVVELTAAYNYMQQCWLFDPRARSFVRHEELDPLIFMKLDPKKKQIEISFRLSGPVYENSRYEWRSKKLVHIYESTSVSGEKMDGSPLPAGFQYWVTRRELRNGVMVKTFDGAVGAAR